MKNKYIVIVILLMLILSSCVTSDDPIVVEDARVKKESRFLYYHDEDNGLSRYSVRIVDRETGVNYLFFKSGYGGGLTLLVDKYGNPIITEIHYEE